MTRDSAVPLRYSLLTALSGAYKGVMADERYHRLVEQSHLIGLSPSCRH